MLKELEKNLFISLKYFKDKKRKRTQVVEGAGLENQCIFLVYRRFESSRFRHEEN